jgi:hypothetical protein
MTQQKRWRSGHVRIVSGEGGEGGCSACRHSERGGGERDVAKVVVALHDVAKGV